MNNELIEHIAFIAAASLLYLVARKIKYLFSGNNYSTKKLYLAATYNVFLGVIYLDYINTGEIPFYGTLDRSILGWLALAMFGMHAFALPGEWKSRPWYMKNRFDSKIRKYKPTFDEYRTAHLPKQRRLFWKKHP